MTDGVIFVLGSFVAACCAKVARLPRPGESLRAEAFTLEPGGKGFNLAVGARRLGATVAGLLAVGDDLFARLAHRALRETGLPESMLRQYEGATGSGIGFTDACGENCLAVHPGANLHLSAKDVAAAGPVLAQAKLVLAQFEIADEPIVEAFARARASGAATLLNPSPFRPIDARIMTHTSILVINRVEAAHLARALGLRAPDRNSFATLAAALLVRGPEAVIVTLGADGAIAYRREAPPLRQPAFKVAAVDTLGAGDAFSSGLATGLIENLPWPDSLRRATACGALATRRLGVFTALPTRAELEAFLASTA